MKCLSALFQLHLSDQPCYCLIRCDLYWRFNGISKELYYIMYWVSHQWLYNVCEIATSTKIFKQGVDVVESDGRRYSLLTHWGRVTHTCVGNLTIIGPDNGLSPGRRQGIIWTNAVVFLIGPWGTSFSEILIGIHSFSFKKIHLKMSSAKWRPFYLGLNVLKVLVVSIGKSIMN